MRVYLSGEIHTDWRDQIIGMLKDLDLIFDAPVTDHGVSDDCGVVILGTEPNKFWHDHKGAKLNAIRTRMGIEEADVVVVRFGGALLPLGAGEDQPSPPLVGGQTGAKLL